MLDVAVIALRWLQYVGAMVLMGTSLFQAYGLPRGARHEVGRVRLSLIVAAVIVSAASLAALILQTGLMAGSLSEAFKPELLGYMVSGTGLGKAFVVRTAAAAAALVLLLLVPGGRRLWLSIAVLGSIVTASFAWTGHGVATEGAGRWIHTGSDVAHALAASVWLGALVAILLLLGRKAEARSVPAHIALVRFSRVGVVAVATLVFTGVVNSAFLVGLPKEEWLRGAYVALLAVKLGLFAIMIFFASRNRHRHVPALKAALVSEEGASSVISAVRRSVLFEAIAGATVLAAVAAMGMLPPPTSM